MYEAALAAYENDRGVESLAKVDSQAKQRLRLAVDQVKIDLSGAESVTLSVDMGDGRPPFEQVWTRQLFEETCSELFSKVLAPVERCALTQSVLLERNCGSLFVSRHS